MSEGKSFCKCSDGWSCIITRTDESEAGKPFSKCGGSCVCDTGASAAQASEIEAAMQSGKVVCKCDEGWKCVIFKSDEIGERKSFFECGEGCKCVMDETNVVRVVSA